MFTAIHTTLWRRQVENISTANPSKHAKDKHINTKRLFREALASGKILPTILSETCNHDITLEDDKTSTQRTGLYQLSLGTLHQKTVETEYELTSHQNTAIKRQIL
mmetsp:Transcript_9300/g.13197  ORF Transcript_9300/g.13197 Transcript_9300/m.13197 type:complete len:106 (-) Transcript_9300:121-438(-)